VKIRLTIARGFRASLCIFANLYMYMREVAGLVLIDADPDDFEPRAMQGD
jgi:hypothetical protein